MAEEYNHGKSQEALQNKTPYEWEKELLNSLLEHNLLSENWDTYIAGFPISIFFTNLAYHKQCVP